MIINKGIIKLPSEIKLRPKKAFVENLSSKSCRSTPTSTKYYSTNRNIKTLINERTYPDSFFDLSDLKDKDVLDVGTGGGAMVIEMKALGINATGIDISHTQIFDKYPAFFKVLDASNTKLPNSSLDRIYSSWSIFTYGEDFNFKVKVMNELKRVLKNGGNIRLGRVNLREIKKIAKVVGGLKVTKTPPKNFKQIFRPATLWDPSWIELTKI